MEDVPATISCLSKGGYPAPHLGIQVRNNEITILITIIISTTITTTTIIIIIIIIIIIVKVYARYASGWPVILKMSSDQYNRRLKVQAAVRH